MKKKLYTILFTFISVFAFSYSLPPSQSCQLIDHLTEVNKEWTKQEINHPELFESIAFENDDQRIQKHLEMVEYFLNNKDIRHLNESQIKLRNKHLKVLNEYWNQGLFPRNSYHQIRQPYFVDNYGTACAVGYLVLEDGQKELVDKIINENNYAYIAEMPYPELDTWAFENGFTKVELAWIQPGYPPPHHIYGTVGNNGGIEGYVNVMKTDLAGEYLYFAGNFSQIDGQFANNIIAYDGENWIDLDAPIEGEIFDIEFMPWGGLIVVGDFLVDGHKNVALYNFNTETWQHCDISEMEGVVYQVMEHNKKVIIGGDFSSINNQSYQNLAFGTFTDSFAWTNSSYAFDGIGTVEVLNSFGVDGPVRALEKTGFHIMVGGDFVLTAPDVSHPNLVTQQETNYLAHWSTQSRNWVSSFDGGHVPVNAGLIHDGAIFVGGEIYYNQMEAPLGIHTGGVWVNPGFWEAEDGMIFDICSYGDRTVIGGDFTFFEGLVGLWSNNLTVLSSDGNSAINTSVNGAVHACAEFQNKLFFAGDFTQASATSVNRLAWTEFELPTNTQEPLESKIKVFVADNQLFIKDFLLEENGTVSLFDLQGRQIGQIELLAGQDDYYFDLNDLAPGTYVYHLETNGAQTSGKFLNF